MIENKLEVYVKALIELDEKYEGIEAGIYADFLKKYAKDLPPDVKEQIIELDRIHMDNIRYVDRGQEGKISLLGLWGSFDTQKIADVLDSAGNICVNLDDAHFSRVEKILPPNLIDAYNEECKKPLDLKTGYPAKYLQELAPINESFGLGKVNEILGIEVVRTKSKSTS